MGERIPIQADDTRLEAYLARPPAGRGPGLVVLQEWWGLVPHIERLCDRFAEEGYLALAPDLYHGEVAEEPDEAARRMRELEIARTAGELEAVVDHLLGRPEVTSQQVGVVGFCMGGALTLVAADTVPDRVAAAVPFYGVFWFGDPDLSRIHCPVLMHVGGQDEHVPVERVEELANRVRAAGAPVSVEVYDAAGHAFMNDTRPTYDDEAAKRAWEATIEFLRDYLG